MTLNRSSTGFIFVGLAGALWSAASRAEGSPTPCTASVDASRCLARLTSVAIGVNGAAWDSNLVNADVAPLLTDAGIGIIRYPGGSTADNYHWMSNEPDDPSQGSTVPGSNFDAYMSVVDSARAEAMITVNYGSGTAAEAAGWVQYANEGGRNYRGPVPTYSGSSAAGHRYRIKYWEIGNELYGDGTYGATWEVNHNGHDPTTYANGVVGYSKAMKTVDPSIRIGVVLTAPGNWPDGATSAASPLPWNDTVLPIACDAIDFVVVHWYPQAPTGESDAALLASPQSGETTSVSYTPGIPDIVAGLKAEVAEYCGQHAGAVQIMVTETNSVSYNPGKQTVSLVDALFLDDAVMTWLENGVTSVDWWAIHDSPFAGNVSSSLYGDYDFGDYGILSSGLICSNGAVEPAVDAPFPAYYGLQMLRHLGDDGDNLLSATSSNGAISIHAVRREDGKLNVMLINKDPVTAYDVTVSLGARVHGLAHLFTYGIGSTSIGRSVLSIEGSSLTMTVAPYSTTTAKLP